MVRTNPNRYEWKIPLELVFLGQERRPKEARLKGEGTTTTLRPKIELYGALPYEAETGRDVVSTHSHRRGDAVHTKTLVIYLYLYDSNKGEKTCHASKSAGKGEGWRLGHLYFYLLKPKALPCSPIHIHK